MLSQKAQVLAHLTEQDSITSWEAIQLYKATRLSAIIFDLKEDGHEIVMTRETSDDEKNGGVNTLLTVNWNKVKDNG